MFAISRNPSIVRRIVNSITLFVCLCVPHLLTACTLTDLAAESKPQGSAWIDTHGKPIHSFACTGTLPFKGDLAPVQIGRKWGYMDKHGKLVIPAQFAEATYFVNGRAVVGVGEQRRNLRDLTWGVIDETGKYVISPQYRDLGLFHDGLARAAVSTTNGIKYGFIDEKLSFVIQPQFDYAYDFSEGLAAVKKGKAFIHATGYCNRSGRLVIAPTFTVAEPFKNGIARVIEKHEYEYIDKHGKKVSRELGLQSFPNDAELNPIKVGNLYGYEDRVGKMVIKPSYRMAFPFSDGYAAAVPQEGSWGYGVIDKTGVFVSPAKFFTINQFSEGLAAAQLVSNGQPGKWGFIKPSGEVAIPFKFDQVGNFSNGLAPAGFEDGWAEPFDARTQMYLMGYVDKTGAFAVKPKYRQAKDFKDGIAEVSF